MLFFELFPVFMTIVVVIVGVILLLVNRGAHHDPVQQDHERRHSEIREAVSTRAASDPKPGRGGRRPSMNP